MSWPHENGLIVWNLVSDPASGSFHPIDPNMRFEFRAQPNRYCHSAAFVSGGFRSIVLDPGLGFMWYTSKKRKQGYHDMLMRNTLQACRHCETVRDRGSEGSGCLSRFSTSQQIQKHENAAHIACVTNKIRFLFLTRLEIVSYTFLSWWNFQNIIFYSIFGRDSGKWDTCVERNELSLKKIHKAVTK